MLQTHTDRDYVIPPDIPRGMTVNTYRRARRAPDRGAHALRRAALRRMARVI